MSKELLLPKINVVILSGRMTADVALRYTPKGDAVANFNLAVDRSYKRGEEWVNETSFVPIVVWSKLAEKLAEKTSKGSAVQIEGYLKIKPYVDKDNSKRSATEIVCHRVHLLEKPVDNRGMEDDAPY